LFICFEISFLTKIITLGGKIFLLLMKDTTLAARILSMGHQLGVFTVGTQIFAPGQLATNALWSTMDPVHVPAILKGFIAIQYIPNYSLLTDIGKEFVNRYRQRNPTLGSQRTCDSTMDNSQTAFLYQSPKTAGQSVCGGMNFSEVSGVIILLCYYYNFYLYYYMV